MHISNLENHAKKYQATTITFEICFLKTQPYSKLCKHLLETVCVLNRKDCADFFLFSLQGPGCYLAWKKNGSN